MGAPNKGLIATWILIILFALILGAIITVIVVATKESYQTRNSRPENLDIILLDRGRQRAGFQIERIDRYMPWVHSIIIIKTPTQVTYTCDLPEEIKSLKSQIPIIHIQSESDDLQHNLMHINKSYTNISEDVLFFGDTTFPIKTFNASQLWSKSHKQRLFNYFHPDVNSIGLQDYFEKTLPVTIINLPKLNQANTLPNYLLSLTLASELVYSPTINQIILLIDNEYTDSHQLIAKPEQQHFFCTMFIIPDIIAETEKFLNQKIINFLC